MTTEEVIKALEEKLDTKGFASKSDVDAINASIEALKNETNMEAVKTAITSIEAQIESLKEAKTPSNKSFKSFREALMSAFDTNKSELDKAITDKGANATIIVKDVVTVGENNTILGEGSESHWLLTAFTGIISPIRSRVSRYLGLVSTGSINNRVAMWVEEYNEQGTPVFIYETDAKTRLSVQYKEREARVQKIAVTCKVTTEMLRDLPQLVSYLQANLIRRIEVATVDELFTGATMLNGLFGYASTFTGGGITTAQPTYADVFRALALQVQKAFGTATAVFVNPDILAQMDMEKSNDGIYQIPPFRSADGTMVAGMQLIPEVALVGTDYDFVGGDLSVVNVRFREGLSINIGQENDDFSKNLRTILAEQALVQFVSANDKQVLVKGKMRDAIALITD